MNRRKAIFRISAAGLGLGLAAGGYRWWAQVKRPDMAYATKNVDLIAALAETIIPRTGTAGARDVKAHEFILKMVRDCTIRKEQNTFIDGLRDIQEYCGSRFGRTYDRCTLAEQAVALTHFQEKGRPMAGKAGKLQARLTGRSFYAILKDYTVEGYCTSRAGATEGLAYQYIPGSYRGCLPLQPGQRSWATN
jgi:hypothetical protein